ncbi:hypothetical protein [Deinococcus radiophilus]|uniref:Uncharacterized protein n=2 Tax=Deinococcus radiophilus TaxID=32062 RepID=A0A3S0JX57_9DEIO|nr:hypothetical protein [Deinococcus radiophilus]RTR30813.1 hypothetical protein EJ104_00745 [Deinococcus radiophilus]UFA49396.1 hypothetical protein LMT64_05615 [Deinococcus radiophilus]
MNRSPTGLLLGHWSRRIEADAALAVFGGQLWVRPTTAEIPGGLLLAPYADSVEEPVNPRKLLHTLSDIAPDGFFVSDLGHQQYLPRFFKTCSASNALQAPSRLQTAAFVRFCQRPLPFALVCGALGWSRLRL